jgi:hypothetical protein
MTSRTTTIVAVVIGAVMVAHFARVSARAMRIDARQGPAIIALVQQQYARPTPALLALRPVGPFEWMATVDPVNCTYQRPHIRHCWEVYFGANVAGPDPLGRSPGKVEVNFIVDADSMQVEAPAAARRFLTR